MIPYGHQTLDEEDWAAVQEVLQGDWLTQGPAVAEFEAALGRVCGVAHVVAVSSGTAALHTLYAAAGIAQGDEVIVPAITFAATANAALYLGARPIFADVTPDTATIDPDAVGEIVTPRTKAIVAVDYAGHPADIDGLRSVAGRHGCLLLEDAAHAIGGRDRGRPVGSAVDGAVFSFHPVKHLTTGEGGAAATSRRPWAEFMRAFRSHGIVPGELAESGGALPWGTMTALGFNYRLPDIQAALGLSQLRKLPRFLQRRSDLVRRYNDAFADLPVDTPVTRKGADPAWHLYVLRLRLSELRRSRAEVVQRLREEDIGAQVHYLPVYWHPYYAQLGYRRGLCPEAEHHGLRCLSLPLFPSLTEAQVDQVIGSVRRVVQWALR